MKKYFKNIALGLALFFAFCAHAQQQSVSIDFASVGDTISLDSVSLIPAQVVLVENTDTVNHKFEVINGTGNIWVRDSIKSGTVFFYTYPLNFSEDYYHKDTSLIQPANVLLAPENTYEVDAEKQEPEFFSGLNKSGSLSRGITVGNSQDAVLNSNLNLQLSGNINPTTTIKASITDNTIPVYAEGISQSLQEFDRVFIEVANPNFGKVQAGDFDIGPSGHYFLNFKKRISGAGIESPIRLKKGTLTVTGVGALARGEFHRNTFRGTEGNQGPYKLSGKNNELVILVISGSERVYIDGRLLVRGLDHDYVIDYSTGELTFTAFRPITKDSRIVVEFQYTVQNFVRSIGYGGANWKGKNWQHSFFMYSEQDAKNQPVKPLNNDQKRILSEAGDDPLKAVSPSWREQNFDANRILYRVTDTLGFDSVFVYSTNPNDTLFEVFFSFVGANKGNYIPLETAANGRIYEFIAPLGGIPQGSHIPYVVLPRPERIQVASYMGAWQDKTQKVDWELAYSNYDPNRFSTVDNENNTGIAGKLGYRKNWEKNKWKYTVGARGEHNSENFKTVERIRNVEFSRDWNLQNTVPSNLWLGGAQFSAYRGEKYSFTAQSDYIKLGNNFNGFKNAGNIKVKNNGWWINAVGSYLSTQDSLNNTSFFRQISKAQKNFKNLQYLGVQTESENNTSSQAGVQNNVHNYKFLYYYAYTGYGDTTKSFIEGGYFNRTDDTLRNDDWTAASLAQGAIFKSALRNPKYGNLMLKVQYRELSNFTDTTLLRSVTTRLQYNHRFWKNFLGWNTFYESGMGREPKRDFKYLKVPKGSGTHIWVDYNNNGIEEVDEFEPAPFPDQADYIRIFVITREYLPVSNLKFTQQLDFNFNNLPGIRGTEKLIGKFNIQTYYLLNKKELLIGTTNSLNPFNKQVTDSLIIQQIETLRATFFFNRSNPVYGADYTYQQNTGKNLLSFGLENSRVREHTVSLRYVIKRKADIRLSSKWIDKLNGTPDFSSRNYNIKTQFIKPSVSYQSNKYLRFTADVTLENSFEISDNNESLKAQKTGVEIKLNHPKIATISSRFEWVKNDFTGNAFSPIGFEMLKGLRPGVNYLWQLSLQKNITSFLQVVLNYNGRSSEDSPTIHTGTVQVKAFF